MAADVFFTYFSIRTYDVVVTNYTIFDLSSRLNHITVTYLSIKDIAFNTEHIVAAYLHNIVLLGSGLKHNNCPLFNHIIISKNDLEVFLLSLADDRTRRVDDTSLTKDNIADYLVESKIQYVWFFYHYVKCQYQLVNKLPISLRQFNKRHKQETHMDINQHFVKICPPSPDQFSPRKPDQTSKASTLRLHANPSQLIEFKIGNYNVRAQRISNNQTIDGYAALYDQKYKLVFEGQFVRSKRNGFGLQYDFQGMLVYQGNFRDDKYDGWGHSSIYTGEYRDGLYDGYGVLSNNSVYYQGYFHRGLFSGEGVYFSGSQMIPFHPIKNVNTFLSQALKNNLQILDKYKIEWIYIGEWKEGRKHGFGRLWKKDYWYAGQYSNDLQHGFGAEEDKKSNKVAQTRYKLGTKID